VIEEVAKIFFDKMPSVDGFKHLRRFEPIRIDSQYAIEKAVFCLQSLYRFLRGVFWFAVNCFVVACVHFVLSFRYCVFSIPRKVLCVKYTSALSIVDGKLLVDDIPASILLEKLLEDG
jgi:hypothetical protein